MDVVNKNILANYAGKLWSFVSIFLFIRLYIDILGIQSYAVINFYTVILGLLAFADAGLTATLNRELAREGEKKDKANLVFTFERIYFVLCTFMVILIFLSSDFIASEFLKSEQFSHTKISYFIKLMGVGIGFQLISTLYEGGLMGLQKQVLTNKIRVFWSLFRSGIVIFPLYFFPNLETYFVWQIFCNFFFFLVLKINLDRNLKTETKPFFSKELLKNIWKYALGMMGIAFISAINIQIDKLVTSKLLDLKSFGYYSLASTISQIPVLVVAPIIVAVFPSLSNSVSNKNNLKLKTDFHKFSFILILITLPIVACLFLYASQIMTLWTGNVEIAESVSNIIKVLSIGGFFFCIQIMPYHIALAHGHTRISILSGIFSLIFIIPLIIYFIKEYNMIGAAIPWLLVNFTTFIVVSIYILNKFLPNEFFKWFKIEILIPTLITIIIASAIFFSTLNLKGKYWFLFDMGLISLSSIFINIFVNNKINNKTKFFDFIK
jgi:O-antigen/teichoic acid export membrane protein